jgi:phospholipid/cholesterol/gamma-HCH transport system permease protein
VNFIESIGRYFIFLGQSVRTPEKHRVYYRQTVRELVNLGVNSILIVIVISLFMGAAIALQTAYNTDNPIYPTYVIGLGVRDSIILEFSSTMVALILAGKVGSHIASQIGTMRITEQIDALEIMGVNTVSYLVMPKIVASVLFFPFLTLISIASGIFGGGLAVISTGTVSSADFIYGIQYDFTPWYVTYSLIKTLVFAFIISSISGFQGFYVTGGSLEVGKASTRAVVNSCILVLLFNLVLTQLLLS